MSYELAGRPISQTRICGLLARQEVVDSIDVKAITGLRLRKIPVYDRPIDGAVFPGDPPDVKGDLPEPMERIKRRPIEPEAK
jgi:hypothetical protein